MKAGSVSAQFDTPPEVRQILLEGNGMSDEPLQPDKGRLINVHVPMPDNCCDEAPHNPAEACRNASDDLSIWEKVERRIKYQSEKCEHGLPMVTCGKAHHLMYTTAQQQKCLSGEHEADVNYPRVMEAPITGFPIRLCAHCRCLFVERA
jgi:hypothetical protein